MGCPNPSHRGGMKKQKDPITGDIVYVCADRRCSYRENEDGEEI